MAVASRGPVMASPTKKQPKRPRTPSTKAKNLADTMEIFRDITAPAQNEGSTPKRARKRPLTLEALLQQVQEGMASIAKEVTSLKDEVQHLRTQLQEKENRFKTSSEPTPSSLPVPYASALGRLNHLDQDIPTQPSSTSQQSEANALHPVQINMTRTESGTYDLPAIKKELESLWEECSETKGIKCRVVKSTKEHTLRLLFKTNADALVVRKYTGWLKGSFQQARVEGEQWYPIKVDRVNKMHLKNLHEEHTHDELCRHYGEENGGVEIKKMRWLGGKTHLLYGSLVVYLCKKEEADRLLENQTMEFQGESGFTKQFIRRVLPQRCFRCQEYGHHQLRCRGDVVCSHCGETGHERTDCMVPSPKCASCQGAHQASDPGCPVYRKMLAEITTSHLHA